MSKFVSKIDGKVFETKEELLKHLENEYIKVEDLDSDSSYSQILSKLKEAFPDGHIVLSESDTKGCAYHVSLSLKTNEDDCESFEFYIGNAEESSYYIQVYETVEEAIEFYGRYPKQTELIREVLADKYELESFNINQWFEADAYSDDFHKVTLDVILNGVEVFLEVGLFAPLDNVIKTQVEPYFTNEIEGVVKEYGHGEWYVGGTELSKFLDRAKSVKVIITELE